MLDGDAAGAAEAYEKALASVADDRPAIGHVSIVGAGPGDPELLTLKALRAIQEADVVLHDNLVGDGVIELIRRDAERIYVGKRKGDHALPQEEIGALMVRLAREGRRVVRLKGGDPYVFGRGGEELDCLRQAGVPATVVPGVTSALGCAASAGVPLTHRGLAQAVTFVTASGGAYAEPRVDWDALARLGHTVVVFMGVSKAAEVSRNLRAGGLDASTPVAVVENGTLPEQRVLRTSLGTLPADIAAAGIEGPAVLIIGEVAARAEGSAVADLVRRSAKLAARGARGSRRSCGLLPCGGQRSWPCSVTAARGQLR